MASLSEEGRLKGGPYMFGGPYIDGWRRVLDAPAIAGGAFVVTLLADSSESYEETKTLEVDDGVTLTLEPASGGAAETLKADVVLVAIGRRPYTEGLGLDELARRCTESEMGARNMEQIL